MRRKNIDMLQGNLWSNILMFTLPLILSGILQLLFNAIDMIVVGKFSGSASMAAVSSTGSLINLITNLFIGLSVGTSVCIARRIGKKEYEEVYKAVETSIMLAVVSGGILMVIGIIFSGLFLRMMGSPEDVIALSSLYLRIYFIGMPATMTYNFASAILRARGDTRRPLFALMIAGVLNALLNMLFVIVFKLDVAGVGLASAISSYVSAFIVIIALVKDETYIHLELKKIYIDKEALIEIAKVGVPAGLQSTIFSISNVAIQSSINSFGKTVMAANGAAGSISDFVYTTMNAFCQSCLTFTSQNIGAGNLKRTRKILLVCLCLVTVFGLVFGTGTYLMGEQLLHIYSDDPEVIAAGMIKLSIFCRPYFLCGFMDVMVGALRGLGSSIFPMITSLLGSCAFRLVWLATYFKAHRSIEVLYYSYPLSWALTAFVHMCTYIFVFHKANRKLKV
ncbi:MAG: MATE family efflux transporter [Erysipelotrichaceae bacterium]|nr:MATE family efflux transporter [Erysipelotrichaceae bacterium]